MQKKKRMHKHHKHNSREKLNLKYIQRMMSGKTRRATRKRNHFRSALLRPVHDVFVMSKDIAAVVT